MKKLTQIDSHNISELFDLTQHFDLSYVKHATYQMFHLFGSPLHSYWTDENQAFGVYLVYYKLARHSSRAAFINAVQKAEVPDLAIFSEDEKLLVEDPKQFRYQALRLREFLLGLAEEFDYEIWLIGKGVQVPMVK